MRDPIREMTKEELHHSIELFKGLMAVVIETVPAKVSFTEIVYGLVETAFEINPNLAAEVCLEVSYQYGPTVLTPNKNEIN